VLLIPCPYCGPRAETEFAFGRALEGAPHREELAVALTRTNPVGVSRELWQHVSGCRAWLVIERDTLSHAIHAVRAAP
jgi:heterotetrameric sarcosine oxidase delta subunit